MRGSGCSMEGPVLCKTFRGTRGEFTKGSMSIGN